MKLCLLSILVILFASCATQKRCYEKWPPVIIDSVLIETETIYRDTTITLPGDSVTLWDTIPCVGVYASGEIKSGNITASYTLSKGKLKIDCKTDSLKVLLAGALKEVKSKETIIKQDVYTIGDLRNKNAALSTSVDALRLQRKWLIIILCSLVAIVFITKRGGLV